MASLARSRVAVVVVFTLGCLLDPSGSTLAVPARRVRRSAGAVRRRRSRRAANQAQPRARPARTSETQWKSSSTRLVATATAIPTAPPARSARVRRPRPRASTSARAAYTQAAVDEWPLGNDGPSAAAAGFRVGRARSTRSLIPLVTSLSPTMATVRNGITSSSPRRLRHHSSSSTAATTGATPYQSPKSVTQVSSCVEAWVACALPKRAAPESTSCTASLPRIRTARRPITSPPPIRSSRARLSRSPVTACGSRRWLSHCRSPGWLAATSRTTSPPAAAVRAG